jgi:hypothetical protein
VRRKGSGHVRTGRILFNDSSDGSESFLEVKTVVFSSMSRSPMMESSFDRNFLTRHLLPIRRRSNGASPNRLSHNHILHRILPYLENNPVWSSYLIRAWAKVPVAILSPCSNQPALLYDRAL